MEEELEFGAANKIKTPQKGVERTIEYQLRILYAISSLGISPEPSGSHYNLTLKKQRTSRPHQSLWLVPILIGYYLCPLGYYVF